MRKLFMCDLRMCNAEAINTTCGWQTHWPSWKRLREPLRLRTRSFLQGVRSLVNSAWPMPVLWRLRDWTSLPTLNHHSPHTPHAHRSTSWKKQGLVQHKSYCTTQVNVMKHELWHLAWNLEAGQPLSSTTDFDSVCEIMNSVSSR